MIQVEAEYTIPLRNYTNYLISKVSFKAVSP